MTNETAQAAPVVYRDTVRAEWVDYNGHLRDAFYMLIYSYATDALLDAIGLDAAAREARGRAHHARPQHTPPTHTHTDRQKIKNRMARMLQC